MFNYCARVILNGWLLDGSFNVAADNYGEAYGKAVAVVHDISLPGSLDFGSDVEVEIVSNDAGEVFAKELKKALNKYSPESLDIVLDEETFEYCVMYHSDNNSFKVFGIDGDELIFEDADPEDWLIDLANKHLVGHCL